MASITQHKDQWRAQVYVKGVRKSAIWPTKREAMAWAVRTEAELSANKPQSKTFADLADRYEREVVPTKRGAQWESRRIGVMRDHFGDAALSALDAPHISAWRDARLRTVTGSTVVRESNLLKHMFSVARDEWRWIEHDPFRGVKMPKENEARHQRWNWKLIKRVLRADCTGKTAEVQAAFHIALRTGMRLQEVLAAPEGLDVKRKVVTLSRTKTTGRDEVPVGRIAVKLLQRPPFEVGANEASTLFAKLTKRLMIDDLTFHDTRATALTLLAKKVDVMTLARISRHKDINLLHRVYYRATADEIAAKL